MANTLMPAVPLGGADQVVTFKPDGTATVQQTKKFYNRSPIILAQSGVASSVTGTTAETTLASIVIPGGMMGANGSVRVTTLWSAPTNANSKLVRSYFGGAVMAQSDLANQPGLAHQFSVQNRGAVNSQVRNATVNTAFGFVSVQTHSFDTTVDQTISLRAALTSAADSLTLERYTVEVLPA